MTAPLRFANRTQWRSWLQEYHATASAVVLVIQRAKYRASGLGLEEAVEEALCFGWIDSTLRSLDERCCLLRFTPRRRGSVWSIRNVHRIKHLLEEGRVAAAGLQTIAEAKESGAREAAIRRAEPDRVPPELETTPEDMGPFRLPGITRRSQEATAALALQRQAGGDAGFPDRGDRRRSPRVVRGGSIVLDTSPPYKQQLQTSWSDTQRGGRVIDTDPGRPALPRVVVIFNLGPPFGGFRLAARAGLLGADNPAVFEALEQAIETAYTLLRAHPPSTWQQLAADDFFTAAIPRYEDREGVIDVTGDGVLRTPGDVLLRAFLPFRFWPLGGWAAYGAWHRESDDGWTSFNEEELRNVW